MAFSAVSRRSAESGRRMIQSLLVFSLLLLLQQSLTNAEVFVMIEYPEGILYETERLEIECTTEQINYNLTWLYNDDINLPDRWSVDGESSLYTDNLSVEDNGASVSCRIQTNDTVEMDSYRLIVIPVPTVSAGPPAIRVETGERVSLRCNASSRVNQFGWTFDGAMIYNDSRYEIREADLAIPAINVSYEGQYTCFATWGMNNSRVESTITEIVVLVRPTFVQQPENAAVRNGESQSLHCLAEGKPPPNITWYQNSQIYAGEGKVLPNGTLIIENVFQDRLGSYECVAANELGQITSAVANLTVEVVNNPVVNVVNMSSNHVTVTWTSYDFPVTYELRLNDSTKYKGEATEYTIEDLQPFTTYKIHVVLHLKRVAIHGDEIFVETEQSVPGTAPRNVVKTEVTSRSVSLEWEEPDTPNGIITGYSLSYMGSIKQVNVTKYTLRGLIPNTVYTVAIAAYTVIGSGPSEEITFRTAEEAPRAAPKWLYVNVTSSTSATVKWAEVAPHDLHGNLTSYTLLVIHDGQVISEINTKETTAEVNNLHKFSHHRLVLFAGTSGGPGPNSTAGLFTQSDMPGNNSAVDVTMIEVSTRTIDVGWMKPGGNLNGNLTGYMITWEGNGASESINLTNETYKEDKELYRYLITGLTPYVNYTIYIQVLTIKGIGVKGEPAITTTLQDAPTEPTDFMVTNLKSPNIMLSWQPPNMTNGIIQEYVYSIALADGSPYLMNTTTQLSVVIDTLRFYTNYIASVYAVSGGGSGPANSRSFTSQEGPPSSPPQNVMTTVRNSRSITITWSPPPVNARNGVIRSYNVTVNERSTRVDCCLHMETGLTPYTNYSVRVAAVTTEQGVFSDTVTNQTNIAAIGDAPMILSVGPGADNMSLRLSWKPPSKPNGPINGYRFKIEPYNNTESVEISIESNVEEYTHTDLAHFTFYNVSMAAMSGDFGDGPYSPYVGGYSGETAPTQVKSVKLKSYANFITISWQPPEYPIGPLTYSLQCDGHPQQNGTSLMGRCTNLNPDTLYSIMVRAYNSEGTRPYRVGAVSRTDISTACENKISINTGDKVTVSLGKCGTLPQFTSALVVLRKLGDVPPSRKLSNYTVQELKSITPTVLLRRRRQVLVAEMPYIAAEIPFSEFGGFTLGDNEVYMGYVNKPLEEALYEIGLWAKVTEGEYISYPTSNFSYTAPTEAPTGSSLLYVAIGIAIGILVVVVIVVIIVVIISCLYCKNIKSDESVGLGSRQGSFRMSFVKKAKLSDPLENFRATHPWPSLEAHPPVPLGGLKSRMTILQADSNFHFIQEYESLVNPEEETYSTESAQVMVNTSKNRYNNIIPYEHTRLKLHQVKNVQGSNYINANHCDGFMREAAYIATQGPLQSTADDFWRMVWEKQCFIIVMLTNITERGKEKCFQYWPQHTDIKESYGQIEVKLQDSIELANFTERYFKVSKAGSKDRLIKHFQFTSWPDHGVPTYPTSMLAFIKRVTMAIREVPDTAGATVVHCSAGVGRTGTYIVIDSMIERIKAGNDSVDVFGHVSLLRTQRNFMVQTEEQYFFIYEAISEYITCGNTQIDLDEVTSYISNLNCHADNGEYTFMEQEFKHLALEKNDPQRFASGNESFNKTKNRYVNILPFESNRVTLDVCRGVDGSDYINASFIDSYQLKDAFIACQAPLENTVQDFWRMVWKYKSPVIVVLTQLTEQGVEQCYRYWPVEQPIKFADITIEPMVGRHTATYTYREFKLSHDKGDSSHTVRHFHFHCWPEMGVPSTGIPLVELIKEVTKMYNTLKCSTPITIHCSSGVGRTGVFIALSIIMERIKREGVIDVFQTVKMLRIQRVAMVQTLEQYQFVYDSVKEVLEKIDSFKSLLRNSGTRGLHNSETSSTFLPKSPTPGASYPDIRSKSKSAHSIPDV